MEEKNYTVIFDTNVLLDLYQKEGIYFALIPYLEKIEDNIIIPNQVYDEYTSKLEEIKLREFKKYDSTEKQIQDIYQNLIKNNQIKTDLKKIFGNINLFDNLTKIVENECKVIEEEIKEIKKTNEKKTNTLLKKDILKDLIERIVTKQKIKKFTLKEFIELFKEGEERIKYKIPPGITDMGKGIGTDFKTLKNKYGDFIIWKEILEYANSNPNRNIYFIENETKSDWWEKKCGKELAKILQYEFNEFSQSKIITLNLENFFKEFKEKLNLPEVELETLERYIKCLEETIEEIQANLEERFLDISNSYTYDNIFKYLENNLFNLIEENDYEYLISNDITGDRFEYIDGLDIYLKNSKNCFLEKNGLNEIVIKGEIEIECELTFQASGGRDVGFSKGVSIIGNLFLEIQLFNFNVNSHEFEGNNFYIENFKIVRANADETELDIYYEYDKEI